MNDFIVFKHLHEDKEKWWGEGEWVSEPDNVEFIYKDYRCRIVRIVAFEGLGGGHVFGGHLCGYVQVPDDLKLFDKGYDLDFDVHGGITYNEKDDDEKNWIGFDCAHLNDYQPSTEYLYKTCPEFIKIKEESKNIFKNIGIDYDTSFVNLKTYKNLEFCINECKNLVDQVIKIKGEDE